jgi:hypothetical protein
MGAEHRASRQSSTISFHGIVAGGESYFADFQRVRQCLPPGVPRPSRALGFC